MSSSDTFRSPLDRKGHNLFKTILIFMDHHHHIAFYSIEASEEYKKNCKRKQRRSSLSRSCTIIFSSAKKSKDSSREIREHLRESPLTPLELYFFFARIKHPTTTHAQTKCIPLQPSYREPLIR